MFFFFALKINSIMFSSAVTSVSSPAALNDPTNVGLMGQLRPISLSLSLSVFSFLSLVAVSSLFNRSQ